MTGDRRQATGDRDGRNKNNNKVTTQQPDWRKVELNCEKRKAGSESLELVNYKKSRDS